ncbi:MAG: hypothetical protein ACOVN5_02135 [Aquidulcibacter sp.]
MLRSLFGLKKSKNEHTTFGREPFALADPESFPLEAQEHNFSYSDGMLEVNQQKIFLRGSFDNAQLVLNRQVSFHDCTFRRCTFKFGGSTRSDFLTSRLIDCRFSYSRTGYLFMKNCFFEGVEFDGGMEFGELRMESIWGLETSLGLEGIEISDRQQARRLEYDLAASFFPLWYRKLSWDKLRGFGSLPFFGLSYGGTALILFLLSVIDHYNTQIGRLKLKVDSSDTIGSLQSFVDRLNPLSLSWQMPTLLIGAVLLMIASTIYAWKCPSRIKEFSLERWTKELGKSAVNYVPLTWRNPVLRWICGVLFWAGSALTVIVLIWRLGQGFSQAWRNW